MFCVAEHVPVLRDENTGRPLELTCYRRNMWQCAGQIVLPRDISHAVTEQGQQVAVFELAASIAAKESIEGKPTEIISVPWKGSSDDSSALPRILLDLATGQGQELDHNRMSLPVAWKRIQFKHATANNGRRKGLQQHYVVQITLLAKTDNGEWLKIAEIESGPVIVRGRSPRNFDSRKDVSLSTDKKVEKRASVAPETPMPVTKTESGADSASYLQRFSSLPEGNTQVREPSAGRELRLN